MARRRITPDRPRDLNQLAHHLVAIATGEVTDDGPSPSDRAAVKRGEARARHTTPEQRQATARKAARARWDNGNGRP